MPWTPPAHVAAGEASSAQFNEETVDNLQWLYDQLQIEAGWSTWTPTWTNLTVGNGTVVARYRKIGRTVHFILNLTWGSTTSAAASSIDFSLPVAMSSAYVGFTPLGTVIAHDNGAAIYDAVVTMTSSTTARMYRGGSPFTATSPMTWVAGDQLLVQGTYEAAA